MIYVIDHQDSFTWNIVHQFRKFDKVYCTNYFDLNQKVLNNCDTIVFSPGPGAPKDYPQTSKIYKTFKGRKKIIGVPHSTHRYWDLRYFFGKLFFSSFSKDIFPDQIAVNGNYSYERCIENGYPESLLKPVEALRYIHHPPKPKTQEKNDRECLNILICCDYQIKTSRELLRIVDKVTHKKIKYDINIRMHPSFPLPAKLIKKYNFRLSDDELLPALQKACLLYTSPSPRDVP